MMTNQEQFTKWFNSKYEVWIDQKRDDGRKNTITDWQNYLGIDQNWLSRWLGGKDLPSDENVEILAAKLGEEIYEVLGRLKPHKNVGN